MAQLRELRGKVDAARKTHERADAEIARLVGSSRGIPFLLEALPSARRILLQMKEDNILPADISEPFVNRVLTAKCCVCGHPHDEQQPGGLDPLQEKTLSVDLNRGLSDLLNAVDDKSLRGYTHQSKEVAAKLSVARDTRSNALKEIGTLEKSVADLEKKLQDSPVEAIRALMQKLRTLASQREQIKGEIAQLEDRIKQQENNLKTHKDKLHKSRPSGALAQEEKVALCPRAGGKTSPAHPRI